MGDGPQRDESGGSGENRPAADARPGAPATLPTNEEGTPVIKGTDIEAHRIAALLDGELNLDQVLEDYPSLTKDQVLAARAYGASHPKPGRPYPSITAKRAMSALGLDALDEVLVSRTKTSEVTFRYDVHQSVCFLRMSAR
jgi:uncharacterized protein (DUF433 family)